MNRTCNAFEPDAPARELTRRAFLGRSALGMTGMLAAADLLQAETATRAATGKPARATRVICLFQSGGPSQMDLFDPKPELNRRAGQKYSGQAAFDSINNNFGSIMGTPYRFGRHGKSGLAISE